ncbi:DUF2934 family protein [Ancylobacter aquaticus]|uniref:DUF2934 family protein n=1 Tax=Ancylobacter aquaticus TaxID=100 RepID=A0A4R1I2I2_ANCAQ|nr:DUF2934 domain-containing protein [Ancylobacter aquaticus]TCK28988.1 DUF2934 family protein [Ancylobacter aquaticus]
MDERDETIRARAHQIWEQEGRPEGRAEDHWVQAKEILAIEEGRPETLLSVEETSGTPVEPIEALVNAGEFPTLTDQGEVAIPSRPSSVKAGQF